MDRIEFIKETEHDKEAGIKRARLVECDYSDCPTFGELDLALSILQRALHTNRTAAIAILRKEDLFKQAVIGYQPIA